MLVDGDGHLTKEVDAASELSVVVLFESRLCAAGDLCDPHLELIPVVGDGRRVGHARSPGDLPQHGLNSTFGLLQLRDLLG